MRVEGAKVRRALLLAASLLTVPTPGGVEDRPLPVTGGRAWQPLGAAASNPVEPNGLELSAPDLLGMALRLEVGPGYGDAGVGQGAEVRDFLGASSLAFLDPGAAHAAAVAEPPRALLLLLMLASVAHASRERHRSPRSRPHPSGCRP